MFPEKKEFKSPWLTELLEKQVVLKSRYDAPLKSNPPQEGSIGNVQSRSM